MQADKKEGGADLGGSVPMQALKPLKTLGCHLIELNTALNLQPDKDGSSVEEKQEKQSIKKAVLNYIEQRNQCLNINKVA